MKNKIRSNVLFDEEIESNPRPRFANSVAK